jgi:hypothetical protein
LDAISSGIQVLGLIIGPRYIFNQLVGGAGNKFSAALLHSRGPKFCGVFPVPTLTQFM